MPLARTTRAPCEIGRASGLAGGRPPDTSTWTGCTETAHACKVPLDLCPPHYLPRNWLIKQKPSCWRKPNSNIPTTVADSVTAAVTTHPVSEVISIVNLRSPVEGCQGHSSRRPGDLPGLTTRKTEGSVQTRGKAEKSRPRAQQDTTTESYCKHAALVLCVVRGVCDDIWASSDNNYTSKNIYGCHESGPTVLVPFPEKRGYAGGTMHATEHCETINHCDTRAAHHPANHRRANA